MSPQYVAPLCLFAIAVAACRGQSSQAARDPGTQSQTVPMAGGSNTAAIHDAASDPWAPIDARVRTETFAAARAKFKTNIVTTLSAEYEPPTPPKGLLDLISYKSPLGDMAAYLSPDPKDGRKHPAMLWIVGGFGGSISETMWQPGPPENDQSASAFWRNGIVTMYPSVRGGNTNPGRKEGLYGEIDDIVAAYRHLASLPYVDPRRVYIGGHSVGAIMALLAAATGITPRGVIAFGPASDYRVFADAPEATPFDVNRDEEFVMRSPREWMHSNAVPTFVTEGEYGNAPSIFDLRERAIHRNLFAATLADHDHFSYIRPATQWLAKAILADDPTRPLVFDVDKFKKDMAPFRLKTPPE